MIKLGLEDKSFIFVMWQVIAIFGTLKKKPAEIMPTITPLELLGSGFWAPNRGIF